MQDADSVFFGYPFCEANRICLDRDWLHLKGYIPIEAQIAILTLFERMPKLRLAAHRLEYRKLIGFRSFFPNARCGFGFLWISIL
jgi:hypothetical protein